MSSSFLVFEAHIDAGLRAAFEEVVYVPRGKRRFHR